MIRLEAFAQEQGFKITQGGRFYHLMGQGGKDQAIADILVVGRLRLWLLRSGMM